MYPLKCQPIFQKRIWGGSRLKSVLAKPIPAALASDPVGESWELADLPPGTVKKDSAGAAPDGSFANLITNGPHKNKTLRDLLLTDAAAIMGSAKLLHGHFPLLIKFLDAQTDLSVQVHPDEDFCRGDHTAHLKSEAWVILHADPGAKIYKGVKPGVTRDIFRAALHTGQVEPLLNAIKVRAGDCHYLRSGTVHALGAGILAAEVQTPSDTTFRVFDWNRLGPDGQPRALHVEQAMRCIDFSISDPAPTQQYTELSGGGTTRLATCDYFTIDRVTLDEKHERPLASGAPTVWIVLEGQGVISCDGFGPTAFSRGDTLLIPANIASATVRTVTPSAWLEARLPAS